MAKKKETDVLIREGQEELDKLKADERVQRKLNDNLYSDNRKLKKELKDMEAEKQSVTNEIDKLKAKLMPLRANVSAHKKQVEEELSALGIAKTEANDAKYEADERIIKAEAAEIKAKEAGTSVTDKRDALKQESVSFQAERNEVAQLKAKYKQLVNDTEIAKHRVDSLVSEKERAIRELEAKGDIVEENIADAKNLKEQHQAKNNELIKLKEQQEEINERLKKSQIDLDARLKEASDELKKIEEKQAKQDSMKRGLDRLSSELMLRRQEVEKDELRIKKIIREKNIKQELDQLKQDLGE